MLESDYRVYSNCSCVTLESFKIPGSELPSINWMLRCNRYNYRCVRRLSVYVVYIIVQYKVVKLFIS